MKHGRTLQELAMELDRQARTKKDYLIDTSLLSMRLEDYAPVLHFPADELSHSGILHINDIAHRQIGQSLGIPAKYYDKMRTENPELLVANVNSWFDTTPQTRMVRTLDDTARAFLSNRYRCIDNYEVAETVLPIIGAMKGASVQSCELTDRRMYIKVVSDRITAEISKGDVVQAGLVISNSEVGMGSVNVRPLIYRLVCSNGMIAEDSGEDRGRGKGRRHRSGVRKIGRQDARCHRSPYRGFRRPHCGRAHIKGVRDKSSGKLRHTRASDKRRRPVAIWSGQCHHPAGA